MSETLGRSENTSTRRDSYGEYREYGAGRREYRRCHDRWTRPEDDCRERGGWGGREERQGRRVRLGRGRVRYTGRDAELICEFP